MASSASQGPPSRCLTQFRLIQELFVIQYYALSSIDQYFYLVPVVEESRTAYRAPRTALGAHRRDQRTLTSAASLLRIGSSE